MWAGPHDVVWTTAGGGRTYTLSEAALVLQHIDVPDHSADRGVPEVARRRRADRLRGTEKEPLWHQTNDVSTRLIIEASKMKCGSEGIAGGGIYFADEAAKTAGKAHNTDFLFKCRVKLGRQQRWTTHRAHNPSYADRHTSFHSLIRENFDSVFIPRGGGDEYVVYSSCQVELLEVACVKSLDPARYASHATWHSVARHVIRVFPFYSFCTRKN